MSVLKHIGILGGTFNPVHIGHIRLAAAIADAFRLERVELMPCAVPPHKPGSNILPFDLRVALLQAALADETTAQDASKLTVSTLENELPPPSYTWNLIHAWRERHSGEHPLFILGGEDFNQLDTWRHGLELPSVTSFAVVPRADAGEDTFAETVRQFWPEATPLPVEIFPFPGFKLLPEVDSVCLFVPLPYLAISASALRDRWMKKQSLRSLTPDAVVDLLEKQKRAIIPYWDTNLSHVSR